jgi:uncharacterized membrane protein
MQELLRITRVTLLGGVVFLIPLVIVVVTVGKAFQIVKVLAQPLVRLFPIQTVVGVAFVDFLTVVLMVLMCLVAGLVARSAPGQKVHEKVDALLLQFLPGYGWIKGVTGNISDEEAEILLKPVLARFDDQAQIGFEVDRTRDGLVAIYIPGAPDPRSGSLSYMSPDRVQPIDAGFQAVLMSFKRLGCGSASMLGHAEP